jgi:peroxiredoxin Q/BCP
MIRLSIRIGEIVPDFTLPSSEGGNVSLQDFRGQNVVLYFYPKDMTPGCTVEACDFRDYHPRFRELNTVVIGISPDPVKSHQRFIEKHDLPFLLLSDEDHRVAEMFGVWGEKQMFGKKFFGINRSTFVINSEGKLVREWRNVKVDGHVEEILSFISGEISQSSTEE